MIAPVNFDVPSRYYLQEHEDLIDEQVKKYLQESGYQIMPDKSFKSIWRKMIEQHGNMYNPTTGKMTDAYQTTLTDTLKKIFANNPSLDAILFTDLIEDKLMYSKGSKKSAQWNGVHRKVKIEGIGNGLSDEFNWDTMLDGISIVTHLIDRKTNLLLHNKGGIQIAQAIEVQNNNGRFKRRKNLLQNEDEIMEGIELSLHPFIVMKNYPLKEKK